MMLSLENPSLRFTLQPAERRWTLTGNGLRLEAPFPIVLLRGPHGSYVALGGDAFRPEPLDPQPSPHGTLQRLCLASPPAADGLRLEVEFAMPEEQPFLFWRFRLENLGRQPAWTGRLLLLDRAAADFGSSALELAFYDHGWQSWSYTAVYAAEQRARRTRLGRLRSPTDANASTPQLRERRHYTGDFFGVLGDRRSRAGVLAGFLSQKEHFGTVEARLEQPTPHLRLWASGDGARLDPGEETITDWACLHFLKLDDPDPLGAYVGAVAAEHGLGKEAFGGAPIPVGWCSWYQFSSEKYMGTVTPQAVRESLTAAAALRPGLPLEIIQIDDGFEAQVGDWFSFDPAFPDGVAPLAAEIRAAGFQPGLWLAPFIVHPRSRLAAEHPDWLLRGQNGRPVNASFLWGAFPTALDLTHPEALDYAGETVRRAVHEWGFPYIKLDFLYAAALPGAYRDPTRSRAQVLRLGLEALREAAGPQATLLGCGCPLGPAIGLVDAMRISTDTAGSWLPSFNGIQAFFAAEPNFPAARNALHNTITRAALHRRWWINDPDCLLLRPQTRLTLEEVRCVATVIALSGGSLLLSDHLPGLPPERLRIAAAMLPLIGQRPVVADWFDAPTPARLRLDLSGPGGEWSVLALINWEDRPQPCTLRLEEFGLPGGGEWLGREFWSGKLYGPFAGKLDLADLAPHAAALLAVRRFQPGVPQYLGSDLHVSQGCEVSGWDWQADTGALALQLERPGPAQGSCDLYLPRPPRSAGLEGQPLPFQPLGGAFYRLPVTFERTARIEILLSP